MWQDDSEDNSISSGFHFKVSPKNTGSEDAKISGLLFHFMLWERW